MSRQTLGDQPPPFGPSPFLWKEGDGLGREVGIHYVCLAFIGESAG